MAETITPLTNIVRKRIKNLTEDKNRELTDYELLDILTAKILTDICHEQFFINSEFEDMLVDIKFYPKEGATIEIHKEVSLPSKQIFWVLKGLRDKKILNKENLYYLLNI